MRAAEPHKSIGDRVIAALTTLILKRPRRMLLLALLIVAGLAPGIGRLVKNMQYYIWFEEGDERLQTLDQFEQRFGSDLASIVYVHSPSGIFDKESAQLLIDLTDRMWKVSETMRVESLSNFPWVHANGDELIVEDLIPSDKELTPQLLAERREVALHDEQLPGFLVSKDGKTAVIYDWLRPTKTGAGANEYNDFIANYQDLKNLLKEFEGRGDHTFHLGGYPVTDAWISTVPPKSLQKLMPLIAGACLLLLFVFFRRTSGVLLPFAVVIPSVIATQGFAGWVGIPINQMTFNTPNILIVIAIASTDNTLFSFFRALDHGLSRQEAARHALHETLGSTFFASAAIALGFLSLLTMTIPPFRDLGLMVGAGTMIVWLLTYLIIGSLMVILPIKPKRVKSKFDRDAEPEDLKEADPRAVRLTGWIHRHRVNIVVAWVLLCALSTWLALHNSVTLDQRTWYYGDMAKSVDFVEANLGYSEAFEILVDTGQEDGIKDPAFLGKIDELASWLRKKDNIVQVTSFVDILKETNRALFEGDPAQYRLPDSRRGVADEYFLYTMSLPVGKSINDRVTLANDALRMTVFSHGRTSPVILKMVDEIRDKAKAMGLKVKITGRALLFNELNPEVVPSFLRSLFTGSIWIAIALLLFFRSVRLGVLSLITNLVPVLVGAGLILFIIGEHYDMATIATFVISFSVSVDDTVHFLESYYRMRKLGFPRKEAIARVYTSVGRAMFFTTLVLSGSFALFTLSEFPWARHFGAVMSLTLLFNFLADFMLGPALLLLLRGKEDRAEAASPPAQD